MGKVKINRLRIFCNLGVTEKERESKQPVLLDIVLSLDLKEACRKDDLAYTVDYDALVVEIKKDLCGESFSLLEALAGWVGEICLKKELVERVKISAMKPKALEAADSSEVEISMSENEKASEEEDKLGRKSR